MSSRLRPYLGPVVALLIVLAVGAGTVYAAIPNGSGTYYACLTKSSGVVRLINYPKVKCATSERFIKWSQQGPAGPAGVQGPKGDPGSAGASGSSSWGDIANKPAGFADGTDDVGYVSVTQSTTYTAATGVAVRVFADHPIGTDVDLTIIPEAVAAQRVNLQVALVCSEEQGHLRATDIGNLDDKDIFMCGPRGFTTDLQRQFLQLGVAGDRIHFEDFEFR